MPLRIAIVVLLPVLLSACGGGGGGGGGDDGNGTPPPPPPPPANNVPIAQSAAFETSDIVAIQSTLTASDADGDALTFAVVDQPSKGVVSISDPATGGFTYTPDPGADGVDGFTFTASDGRGTSEEASVIIELFGWPGSQQFGTSEEDYALTGGMVVSADRGLVFGGYSDADVDGQGFGGERDAWVRKVTRRGEDAWTFVSRNAEAESVRNLLAHPSGEGYFATITRAPTAGSLADKADLVRLNNDGIQLWRTEIDFGPVATIDYAAYWTKVADDGDLYVISWVDVPFSAAVTRLDGSDGSFVWSRKLEPSSADPLTPLVPDSDFIRTRGIAFDADGNVIISGNFTSTGGRPCVQCGFLAALDPDGDILWTREITDVDSTGCGALDYFTVFRVTTAPDDSLLVLGDTQREPDGTSVGFVFNFSPDGTTLNWEYCDAVVDPATQRSDFFTELQPIGDDDHLLYGAILGPDDPMTGLPDNDLVVIRLDSAGNEVFRRVLTETRADGSGAEQAAGSIGVDQDFTIFLTGAIDGELSPGSGLGGLDGFIRRLGADGTPR